MSISRISAGSLLLLLKFSLFTNLQAGSPNLSLSVRINKTNFVVGAAPTATLTIKNTSLSNAYLDLTDVAIPKAINFEGMAWSSGRIVGIVSSVGGQSPKYRRSGCATVLKPGEELVRTTVLPEFEKAGPLIIHFLTEFRATDNLNQADNDWPLIELKRSRKITVRKKIHDHD
jgi:hypothetical protein